MGWTHYESYYDYDDPRGLYVIQTTGEAYGRYQFDYHFGLVPFMQFCQDQDPVAYAGFTPYIAMGASNPALINNQGLLQLFEDYTNRDFDEFQNFQDVNGIEDYLEKALNLIPYQVTDPVVLGSVFSMAIRGGYGAAADCMPPNPMPAVYTIQYAYNEMSQLHYDSGRWVPGGGSQYDAAMAALANQTEIFGIPWGYIPKPRVYPWMIKRRPTFTASIKRRF